jgi:CDP-glucose 4,6-dehydratase
VGQWRALGGVGAVTTTQTWRGRRVLVTGATGLIGSWLTRRLVDLGAHVVTFVLDPDPQSELVRSGTIARTSVVMGRLECYEDVERAVVGHETDTVFHLGAQTLVGVALRAPLATLQANVAGTWNVTEAARRHSDLVRRVVVASSYKAYGESPQLPYVEDMALRGSSPYDVSKSCTDLVTQSYAHTYGVPAVIARCGNVFGGGDLNWSRIVPGTLRALLTGEQPVIRSDGTFLRDYIYVDDVVDAYLRLDDVLDDATLIGEAFNFSDEHPMSVMDIYRAICSATGAPETEPLILGRAEHEIHDQYLSASKARERLGWKPTFTIQEGLVRTVAWYREFLAADSAGGQE